MQKAGRVVAACAVIMATAVALGVAWSGPSEKADAATKGYHVPRGPVFNSATGPDRVKYAINDHIKRAINHAPRGSTIRIMSWNIHSAAMTDRLLRAQKRGVRVQVLMDSSNWSTEVPNRNFARLKAGLAKGNKGRKPGRWSAAKVCQGSCRGKSGSAHAKYYIFSWSGKSSRIVMEGSANITSAAATNQWNDMYTWVGNRKIYDFAVTIFKQAWQDKRVTNPWRSVSSPPFTLAFAPQMGKYYTGDPATKVLSKVSCKGATNGNAQHRTIIRFFPDVMRGNRGLKNAQQLKALWNHGCDVEVGYTVMSYKAYKVLTSAGTRGKVPVHHMAVDNDGDGEFDKYFHLKVLTVNGVVGNDKAAYSVVNGSSNASGLSAISDENIAVITKPRAVLRYQKHLTYWFAHAPGGSASTLGGGDGARLTVGDGSSVGRLVTPSGTKAATSDGYIRPGTKVVSPLTGKVVDPYANIDMD
ncbi:phospholipase D-like domain-containing protein [Nocardioides cheoyonin]|uniref:phospholipase D-like domain-containing protein n=1 Tax=Nocardioides cheoyonin TaxID=3156615 RepID=UPI0032B5258C